MSRWRCGVGGEDVLTKKLRDYSVKNVKIAEVDMTRSRKLVKEYVENQIMAYCRQNSTLPILRLEYTGSVYERLKTEAADEVDVMVVLKTATPLLWGDPEVMVEETDVPGYVRLKARKDSKLRKYASSEGYIKPERLRNGWFYSLVVQAVRNYEDSLSCSDIQMIVRYHGPAVQLDLKEKESHNILLSVDLVPCFQVGPDQGYFVAKPYTGQRYVSHSGLLWRQSFSLGEKTILQHMDRDSGCRHELLRIVKTIVKRDPTSLGVLESYHLKTAFMHYIKEKPDNWNKHSLGKHFHEFLQYLQEFLEKGDLPHYWLPGVNLLEDINPVVVENMAYRLQNILNSEAKMNRILVGCSTPESLESLTMPEMEGIMQGEHIDFLSIPQGDGITQNEENHIYRYRMLENEEYRMQNPLANSLKLVLKFVLRLVLGLVSVSFGLLICLAFFAYLRLLLFYTCCLELDQFD